MTAERLQKILSNAGKASRRTAERWILAGRIAVNGTTITTLGSRADPAVDEITVDGVPVIKERYRYFVLNKPTGFLTTARDDRGRDTVLDLVPIGDVKLHPVGRLDLDSEGLVVLTNDGHMTDFLTHPRHQVEKEYLVVLDRELSQQSLKRMVRGVDVDGDRLAVSTARVASPPPGDPMAANIESDGSWLLVTLRRGRNREIRRLLAALGYRTVLLRRIRVGALLLGELGSGSFRELTTEEVEALYGSGAIGV